eukprot:XP_001692449.1 predicted protein [Chlamydomonas reinhardtii]
MGGGEATRLEKLYIRDFALVTEQTVRLGPGLNVITGESGSGKSVLIALAPGGGLRSRVALNGAPSSLRLLRELAGLLVDTNGQHSTLALRDPATQLELLDRIAGTAPLAAAYGSSLAALRAVEARLDELDELDNEGERARLQKLVDAVKSYARRYAFSAADAEATQERLSRLERLMKTASAAGFGGGRITTSEQLLAAAEEAGAKLAAYYEMEGQREGWEAQLMDLAADIRRRALALGTVSVSGWAEDRTGGGSVPILILDELDSGIGARLGGAPTAGAAAASGASRGGMLPYTFDAEESDGSGSQSDGESSSSYGGDELPPDVVAAAAMNVHPDDELLGMSVYDTEQPPQQYDTPYDAPYTSSAAQGSYDSGDSGNGTDRQYDAAVGTEVVADSAYNYNVGGGGGRFVVVPLGHEREFKDMFNTIMSFTRADYEKEAMRSFELTLWQALRDSGNV